MTEERIQNMERAVRLGELLRPPVVIQLLAEVRRLRAALKDRAHGGDLVCPTCHEAFDTCPFCGSELDV